jgi:hypothetical protein
MSRNPLAVGRPGLPLGHGREVCRSYRDFERATPPRRIMTVVAAQATDPSTPDPSVARVPTATVTETF